MRRPQPESARSKLNWSIGLDWSGVVWTLLEWWAVVSRGEWLAHVVIDRRQLWALNSSACRKANKLINANDCRSKCEALISRGKAFFLLQPRDLSWKPFFWGPFHERFRLWVSFFPILWLTQFWNTWLGARRNVNSH